MIHYRNSRTTFIRLILLWLQIIILCKERRTLLSRFRSRSLSALLYIYYNNSLPQTSEHPTRSRGFFFHVKYFPVRFSLPTVLWHLKFFFLHHIYYNVLPSIFPIKYIIIICILYYYRWQTWWHIIHLTISRVYQNHGCTV